MPNHEEETYSIVFQVPETPILRKILWIPSEGSWSFSEIQVRAWSNESIRHDVIWDTKMSKEGNYSYSLPSRGCHTIGQGRP